ncbi:MAG: GNAT family N-acetyltransferase [Akkermansiaceae bacterium]|jgi:GNAT superfamily N-acetyltransferase|nr:GNAT family N-acetyltransferase [Akkermansiaceae bacterium]
MSSFALEILGDCHDRASFSSGLEPVDRYLRETARGHFAKGVSVTRVLVDCESSTPKPILGFFTLSSITVDAKDWPGSPKGLPKHPVSAVLLGRLAVAESSHQRGIGSMLLASARQLARETIHRTGGLGLVVDAANEQVVEFYARFGFRRETSTGLRMFLPAASLEGGAEIPRG